MRPLIAIAILVSVVSAGDARIASPDGRYEVEYFEGLPGESNVKFKDARTGQVLRYGFTSGYEEKKFRAVSWSPDSRFLALVSRGTKTTSDIEILRFDGESISEVMIPDYRLNILGRKHLITGGRHHWVSEVQWSSSTVTFRCRGQWVDGSGDPQIDPSNWYHFAVTLEVSHAVSPNRAKLIAVSPLPPAKTLGEQDGADHPTTRSESKSEGSQKPRPETEGHSR